jgi:hypothetical protein
MPLSLSLSRFPSSISSLLSVLSLAFCTSPRRALPSMHVKRTALLALLGTLATCTLASPVDIPTCTAYTGDMSQDGKTLGSWAASIRGLAGKEVQSIAGLKSVTTSFRGDMVNVVFVTAPDPKQNYAYLAIDTTTDPGQQSSVVEMQYSDAEKKSHHLIVHSPNNGVCRLFFKEEMTLDTVKAITGFLRHFEPWHPPRPFYGEPRVRPVAPPGGTASG